MKYPLLITLLMSSHSFCMEKTSIKHMTYGKTTFIIKQYGSSIKIIGDGKFQKKMDSVCATSFIKQIDKNQTSPKINRQQMADNIHKALERASAECGIQ